MKIGVNARIYRNTGSYGTPTWLEISKARDVTATRTASEVDASTRSGRGIMEYLQGMKDNGISFDIPADPDDTAGYVALRAAFDNGSTLDIAAVDGDISGDAEGLRMQCVVTEFTVNEPMADLRTVSVTLKPTPNANSAPEWFGATTTTTT